MFSEETGKLLLQGGSFVLVAWLFYYTFSYSLPALLKTFRDETEAQRSLFESTLRDIRNAFITDAQSMFAAELRLQRSDFREELSKQRHGFLNVINALNLQNHELLEHLRSGGIHLTEAEKHVNLDPDANPGRAAAHSDAAKNPHT